MATYSGYTVLMLATPVGLALLFFLYLVRPRRGREPAFEYVYVEDVGTVRELDEDDEKCLSEHFHPNDGNRPYIKLRYESKTSYQTIKRRSDVAWRRPWPPDDWFAPFVVRPSRVLGHRPDRRPQHDAPAHNTRSR